MTVHIQVNSMGNKKVDSIACPNQMRLNGIYVNDLSRQIFPDIDKAQNITADKLRIPLYFYGPLAYLNTNPPTATEISNYYLQRIALTSPHRWNPYGVDCLSLNKQNKPFQVSKASSFLSYALRSLFVFNTTKNRSINPEDIMASIHRTLFIVLYGHIILKNCINTLQPV